uniref:BTB domain-containing protein n=1 Tax=Panagrellus redivivus TaxID=6233 RepID=A0A7E4USB2_PANRE
MSVISDSISIVLKEVELKGMDLGRYHQTGQRNVPGTGGLNKWWIQYYPAGYCGSDRGYSCIHLYVTKPLKATFTANIVGTAVKKTVSHKFSNLQFRAYINLATHAQLGPYFNDGQLTIECFVQFETFMPFLLEMPTVFYLFEDAPLDFEFIVSSNHLPVHKNFLSLISPVFRAMFANDTLESQTGQVVITDFDFAALKTAIDYCYGRELKIISPDTYVDVLRFADKYMIKALIEKLEEQIPLNLSTDTFFHFFQYAFDYSKDTVLTKCYIYFKAHQDELKDTTEFFHLPISTVVTLLKAAFDLETKFDVLRHANNTDMSSYIIDLLEASFFESLTLDEFSVTAEYAWEYSREKLQKACAEFLTDNRFEVTTDKAFLSLPGNLIKNVLVFSSKI